MHAEGDRKTEKQNVTRQRNKKETTERLRHINCREIDRDRDREREREREIERERERDRERERSTPASPKST